MSPPEPEGLRKGFAINKFVNTFSTPVAAQDVLARYQAWLGDPWRLVRGIDAVDARTYRGEWESGYHVLRVTASGQPATVNVEYETKEEAPEVAAALARLIGENAAFRAATHVE